MIRIALKISTVRRKLPTTWRPRAAHALTPRSANVPEETRPSMNPCTPALSLTVVPQPFFDCQRLRPFPLTQLFGGRRRQPRLAPRRDAFLQDSRVNVLRDQQTPKCLRTQQAL